MKRFLTFFLVGVIGLCFLVFTKREPEEPLLQQHRFLVMISSFKRPMLATGQVLRFFDGSYQNFDISLSMKGLGENFPKTLWEKTLTPFLQSGRLKLRYDANKAQYANLLDTVRDVDLTQYDYFCKVDDDDWYTPGYLQSVNRFINESALEPALTSGHNAVILEWGKTTKDPVSMWRYTGELTGPTFCFSREVIEIALAIEKDPSLAKNYTKDRFEEFQEVREDAFLAHLAAEIGLDLKRDRGAPQIIYGWQFPSVMRSNYR